MPHRTNIRFVSGYAGQPKNEKISFAKVGDIVQRTGMLVIGAGIVGAMFKGADAMQKGADAMQKGVVVWERSVDSVDNWGCVFGLIFCLLKLLACSFIWLALAADGRQSATLQGERAIPQWRGHRLPAEKPSCTLTVTAKWRRTRMEVVE